MGNVIDVEQESVPLLLGACLDDQRRRAGILLSEIGASLAGSA
jgi:hypothetical protein